MTETTPICPVCEEAELVESRYLGRLNHGGRTLEISDLECWDCPACGADAVFPDQARRNHLRYQDARRRADGLLTGEQITRLLERLGLTQIQAAEIFGGGRNAFSKYVRGEVIQSQAMDRLLRLAAASTSNLQRLKQWSGQLATSTDTNVRKSTHRTNVVPLRQPASARDQYKKGAKTDWHTEREQA